MAPYLVPKDRILKMFMFAGAVGSFISNITAPLLNWLKVNMKNIKGVKKKNPFFLFSVQIMHIFLLTLYLTSL